MFNVPNPALPGITSGFEHRRKADLSESLWFSSRVRSSLYMLNVCLETSHVSCRNAWLSDLTLTFEVVHCKHTTQSFGYTCHSRCRATGNRYSKNSSYLQRYTYLFYGLLKKVWKNGLRFYSVLVLY